MRAVGCITAFPEIQEALAEIIDDETEVNGRRGMVRDIHRQET
jgi:hypothetical protein